MCVSVCVCREAGVELWLCAGGLRSHAAGLNCFARLGAVALLPHCPATLACRRRHWLQTKTTGRGGAKRRTTPRTRQTNEQAPFFSFIPVCPFFGFFSGMAGGGAWKVDLSAPCFARLQLSARNRSNWNFQQGQRSGPNRNKTETTPWEMPSFQISSVPPHSGQRVGSNGGCFQRAHTMPRRVPAWRTAQRATNPCTGRHGPRTTGFVKHPY